MCGKSMTLTVAGVILAGVVHAAMIVPPADLAELAATSRTVVLAQAVEAWSTPGPYVPHTVTRFHRVELVSGEDPGDFFQVSVPGGEADGVAAVVAGAPAFRAGAQYLLFLAAGRDGEWRVRMMAYGVFEKVRVGETVVLAPVPEREEVGFIRRFDVEVPGVYRARALLDSLRSVTRGESVWDARRVLAPPEMAAEIVEKSAPSACRFMTYSDGYGIRWFTFDGGGSATIRATTPGQTGISDGGVGAVSGGAAAWTNDPGSLIDLQFGGSTGQSISCSGGGTHYQAGAVVFDDPCGDIDPLSNCSGTLAYGGPLFYTSTQSFDGQPWHPASGLFVVVNDGSECVGETNFSEFVTHELGHGLGFGHHTDSDATMYAYCCHYPRGANLGATDSTCAAYLYPDAAASPPPTAPTGLSATAASETRIDLSWVDTSSDETGFRVYRSTGGSFQLIGTVGANASAFSDTTLAPCMAASYYVTAYNTNGESSASNVAGDETSGQAPQAPSSLAAQTPDPSRVVLTWSNGSVPQSSVFVERAIGSGGFVARATLSGSATSYQDSTVQEGSGYRYRLRASNSCGYSAYSDEVSVTVPSDDEPLTVDFSWTPAAPWVGEDVSFTVSSSGEPDSLVWDLGDGSTANGTDVDHRYATAGNYLVRLTASRAGETVTATRTLSVATAPELVAASARTAGLNGTSWRTDAVLLNAGSAGVRGRLTLRGGDGSELGALQYDLDPQQMVSIEDVVGSMGITGTGSLVVEPTQGAAPAIMTRTYTGDEDGTFGQAIPPQIPAHSGTQVITGLRGSPGFRTNFGVASASPSTVQVSLTLHTGSGSRLGPTLSVAPFQQNQWPLESLFGAPVLAGVSAASLEVSCSGPVAVYASVVDDDSGDPIFLPGETPSTSWLVPIVGRGPGEEQTWWDTELVLYNAGQGSAAVDLEYLPANVGNAAGGAVMHLALGSGETRRFEEAQRLLWGVSTGLGSVVVSASRPLVVVARVATPRPGALGSMGQRIPALPTDLISGGESVLPWVRWDQDFRTNIGIYNGSQVTRSVVLELHSEDGSVAATTTVAVPPRSLVQRSQESLFGQGGGTASGWVKVVGARDELVLYASQVDNGTGDPVYVPGE